VRRSGGFHPAERQPSTLRITYRSPTAYEAIDLGVGAVAISARRIQYLTVSYLDPEPDGAAVRAA
jgi:hypothetical protein